MTALTAPSSISASDYFHSCSDPSGSFVISDGTLFGPNPGDDAVEREEIKFTETSRLTIRRIEGHCVSKKCKQTFRYEAETYLLDAEFEFRDIDQNMTFLCDFAADGTPAMCECDEDVVTFRTELKPAHSASGKPRTK
jgi:hypothetical protein